MTFLRVRDAVLLVSLWQFDHFRGAVISATAEFETNAMLYNPRHAISVEGLAHRIGAAQDVTADLLADAVAEACADIPALKTTRAARVHQLIAAGAWTDAALALIELVLPAWHLRRLVCEDGEWHCSLSQELAVPEQVDDTADAHHPLLPLAMLGAFEEARRRSGAPSDSPFRLIPRVRTSTDHAINCDNYA